jgi:hypothetical protein
MVDNARPEMNLGGLLSQRLIPELDLSEASNDSGAGAVTTIDQSNDLSVLKFVSGKFAFSPVEAHHTSGTTDADVIHGPFASHYQNLFH